MLISYKFEEMLLKKEKNNEVFFTFLLLHLIIWTLVPAITNNNLPLDTIEALAWEAT